MTGSSSERTADADVATVREEAARDFVRALDLHKAEIQRLRELVCECGHVRDFDGRYVPTDMHDDDCPARPPAEEPSR